MQCPSCRFENIPGQTTCVRCRSILESSAIKVDVHPPRATFGRKQIRSAFPTFSGVMNRISEVRALRFGIDLDADLAAIGVLARMVLPGWSHLYCGYKHVGVFFLCVYAALMLLFALFVGTPFGAWILGATLAWHVIAVMHLLTSDAVDWWGRLSRTYVVYVVLMLWYVLGWWTLQRVVNPITVNQTFGQIQRGDVVFVSQGLSPRVGKCVYYRLPVRDVTMRRNYGATNYRFGTHSFDRILAHSGQTYSIQNGQLIVDGVQSKLRPVSGEIPAELKMSGTVPPGHWLILPGMVPNSYLVEPFSRIAIVPESMIESVLFLKRRSLFSWEIL